MDMMITKSIIKVLTKLAGRPEAHQGPDSWQQLFGHWNLLRHLIQGEKNLHPVKAAKVLLVKCTQIADFIQKKCPARAFLDQAAAGLLSTGKRTFFMSKNSICKNIIIQSPPHLQE